MMNVDFQYDVGVLEIYRVDSRDLSPRLITVTRLYLRHSLTLTYTSSYTYKAVVGKLSPAIRRMMNKAGNRAERFEREAR